MGHVVMWANGLLIAAIFSQVALRYLFSQNYPKLDEIQWHFYGLGDDDRHFLCLGHRQPRPGRRCCTCNCLGACNVMIEVVGILTLLTPFIYLMIDQGYDYFYESFRVDERSDSPTGLAGALGLQSDHSDQLCPFGFGGLWRA